MALELHLPLTFAHITELLCYGPVSSQAQHRGLDGMQVHMSGSEQKTQFGFWVELIKTMLHRV